MISRNVEKGWSSTKNRPKCGAAVLKIFDVGMDTSKTRGSKGSDDKLGTDLTWPCKHGNARTRRHLLLGRARAGTVKRRGEDEAGKWARLVSHSSEAARSVRRELTRSGMRGPDFPFEA